MPSALWIKLTVDLKRSVFVMWVRLRAVAFMVETAVLEMFSGISVVC